LAAGLGLAASLVAVISLPLVDWGSVTEGWGEVSRRLYLSPLFVVTGALGVWIGRRSARSVDYLEPREHSGMLDVAPSGIEARLTRLLNDISLTPTGGLHIVRLVLLTGGSTLHYLDHVTASFPWPGSWEIRVLITDPDSPIVDHLGPGARDQIVAGIARLTVIGERCTSKPQSVRVVWRTYKDRPFFRGGLLDHEYLVSGYFVWSEDQGDLRLVEQNKRLAFLRARSRFGADTIDAFAREFDYRWNLRE
jgi:hypothetical protein